MVPSPAILPSATQTLRTLNTLFSEFTVSFKIHISVHAVLPAQNTPLSPAQPFMEVEDGGVSRYILTVQREGPLSDAAPFLCVAFQYTIPGSLFYL